MLFVCFLITIPEIRTGYTLVNVGTVTQTLEVFPGA